MQKTKGGYRMDILLIFNRNPYDGTDVTWNGLRLADALLNQGSKIAIFLQNDAVDLCREVVKPPEGYFDLGKMLKDLRDKGVPIKACGTCKVRCGIYKGHPYFEGIPEAKITELAEWISEAKQVICF